MRAACATAPGKAVLCGEYVVLHEGAAIAAAVDRRARVAITDAPADCHVVNASGYLSGSFSFTMGDDGEFAWHEPLPPRPAFALVEEIWTSFDNSDWPPLSIEIDTRDLYDAGTGLKLGLGSSAAVAVALAAALQKFFAVDCDVRQQAFDAHDRFQRGRGSGVDVAASHDGGLILYRRAGRESRRLDRPEGLEYRFLWSGRTADTAEKLAGLGAEGARDLNGDVLTLLADHAEALAAAWSLGESGKILDSYPAYIDALRRFSAAHGLGVFDAGHEELTRAATGSNVVYKPCGAGGGDIGIVLGACEHDVNEFCRLARRQSFSSLDLGIEEQGVLFAE